MRFSRWLAGPAVAVGMAAAGASAASVDVQAVMTNGSGRLTKCRDWLITYTCKRYHHVEIPMAVAVGQSITLNFGSNPKQYEFPVARIALDGRRCTLYSEATGDPDAIDRVDVSPCHAAPAGGPH